MSHPPPAEFFSCGSIVSLNSTQCLIGWGERSWHTKPSYPCWIFPDFFLEAAKPYCTHPFTRVVETTELLGQLQEEGSQTLSWSSPDWGPFERAVQELKASQHLSKVVPYVQKFAAGEMSPKSIAQSLKSALRYQMRTKGTFLYGFWDSQEGMLGVTPEILFKWEEGQPISTMACAGTAPAANAEQMLQDAKLREEHRIVIEGICRELAPYGQVEVGTTAAKTFSRLAHLVTPIEMRITPPLQLEALLQALHPTPALGAYPKQVGAAWLRKYALALPRSRYGAPVGVMLSPEQGVMYVAIRNIQWEKSTLTLTAGCGIVADSVLEQEKQEILVKMAAIQEILSV